jgi:regulator of protease activity HflC (stomatin/prohibitin superfamily)
MDAVLTERVAIADAIKEIVDKETNSWGVDIESIKIQELELPAEMKRAMAKQAEAERERRATIIASQGELSAAENLRDAANTLADTPGALHLRTLQTIRDIASDPSEKLVLFLPSDLGQIAKQITGNE